MSINPTDLSALLASRICHDLISPIGAIGNGIELLQLSGFDSPELNLINDAVNDANQRIRYFRVAFGTASIGQMIGAAEMAKVLPADTFGPKLSLNWQPGDNIERCQAKLALLTLLCLESCMPYGGALSVAQQDRSWRISGHADRMNPMPELWKLVTAPQDTTDIEADTAPAPAPAHLHFALLGLELALQGCRAHIDTRETEIIISFQPT